MVQPLPLCSQPRDEDLLWRYMDFTKFVDLVSTRQLFFCRADKLGDPFEGTYTASHIPSNQELDGLTGDERERFQQLRYFEIAASHDNRKLFFVSCWHANVAESAAMWNLYSQSNESIAIQTRFGRLVTALALAPYHVFSGCVSYRDYRTERIDEHRGQMVFMSKRRSYEHEREVRLLFWSVDDVTFYNTREEHEPPPGYGLECDLDELIETIYVSPTSQDWFVALVRRVCQHWGVNKEVVQSDLASTPFF
jgi:hypothetical protein